MTVIKYITVILVLGVGFVVPVLVVDSLLEKHYDVNWQTKAESKILFSFYTFEFKQIYLFNIIMFLFCVPFCVFIFYLISLTNFFK